MEILDSFCVPPSTDEFGANVKAAQAIDEEIETYQAKIRALKTRRNELVLISQLPPELLSTVFQLVQWNSRALNSYPRTTWTPISQVCGHWRRVALQSPRLWSCIDIYGHESGPDTWVETFLERSKQAPLSISAKLTPRSLLPIKAALKKMDRVRHLSLILQSSIAQDLLEILETHSAPLLESLEMRCTTNEISGYLPNRLFAGDHPSLQVLKLVNFDLTWNLPPLDKLTTLHISNSAFFTRRGQGPSMLQLISILRISPNLERLDLEGLFPVPGPEVDVGPPVFLPNLTYISLKSGLSSSDKLLNHISFSATSSVSVHSLDTIRHILTDLFGIMRRTFNPESIIGVRPPIRYLKVLSPQLGGFSLKVDAWCHPGSNLEEPSDGPKFSLHVDDLSDIGDPSIGEGYSTFWSILPLEGLNCLELAGFDFGKSAWLDLSGRLEHLVILKLEALHDKAAATILDILSSKRSVVQKRDKKRRQKARYHLPALCELSLTGWNFESPPQNLKQTSKRLKHLITCLKKRKKFGVGIHKLNLECCRYLFSSGVEELKKVVPHIIWDGVEEITDSEDGDYGDDEDYDYDYGYDYWDGDEDYDSDDVPFFF